MKRDEWHKTPSGGWSLSLGYRGRRVRVFQRVPGGNFEWVTWRSSTRRYGSLNTSNREVAKARAKELLERLEDLDRPSSQDPLTLEKLWDLYRVESPDFRSNSHKTQGEKRRQAVSLIVGFGGEKLVETLTKNDIGWYARIRETGQGWPDGVLRLPVRRRSVQADLQLLRTMVNWACGIRLPNGASLLSHNPLIGVKLPREENPRRALATAERFDRTIAAVRALAQSARQERGRQKWVRVEMALVLANATGRRIGSIRGLRWSDVDFDESRIWWNPDFDKRNRDSTVPIPKRLRDQLKNYRAKLSLVGDGWLFPNTTGNSPWTNDLFGQALRVAETHAKLPKLSGSLWHAYRRKWAVEKKDFTVSDVMAAGGWRDLKTFFSSYQVATEEGLRKVMA